MMAELSEIVAYCDERVRRREIPDFDGSCNGLQVENDGQVRKIAAAVDAGRVPFQKAIEAGADFLICHHGMFWSPPVPLVGAAYRKVKTALDGNLAVYGAHLPLDCHPEIGNNALLADALGLKCVDTFVPYEGNDIAVIAEAPAGGRTELAKQLRERFPKTYQGIEYGSEYPARVAILTGSGQSAVGKLEGRNLDTLITGELRQHHFNQAQEHGLNLYPCGHYATEIFGVKALAAEVAAAFGLEWTFIEEPCLL